MTGMARERLVFAGFEAALGIAVLAAFWALGAVGLLGGLVLGLTGVVASSGGLWGGLAALGVVVALLGRVIARGARQFRVIEVLDDGRWWLRNPLGIVIGRIAADQPRVVAEHRAETWMFTGTARKYTQAWIELTANGRTWSSTHSTPRYQATARAALGRHLTRMRPAPG
jgi:hypothetical protein